MDSGRQIWGGPPYRPVVTRCGMEKRFDIGAELKEMNELVIRRSLGHNVELWPTFPIIFITISSRSNTDRLWRLLA